MNKALRERAAAANEIAKKVVDKKISLVKERLEKSIEKLHKVEIFHHDLHDDNIIVTSKGDIPRIIDFGMASDSRVFDWRTFFGDDRHGDYRILNQFDMNKKNYNRFQSENKVTRLVLDKIMQN